MKILKNNSVDDVFVYTYNDNVNAILSKISGIKTIDFSHIDLNKVLLGEYNIHNKLFDGLVARTLILDNFKMDQRILYYMGGFNIFNNCIVSNIKIFNSDEFTINAIKYKFVGRAQKSVNIITENSTEVFKTEEDPYKPITLPTLKRTIKAEIKKQGAAADLNCIDVSNVVNMEYLFPDTSYGFVGDISKWDVHNVRCMRHMFMNCQFNGDISNWDVSNVNDASAMFNNSKFDGDISNWNMKSIIKDLDMFLDCNIAEENRPKITKRI